MRRRSRSLVSACDAYSSGWSSLPEAAWRRPSPSGERPGLPSPSPLWQPRNGGGGGMRTESPRIAIVGAGGWVFPLELSRDILSFPSLSGCELVLYDIDVPAADRTRTSVETLIGIGGLAARVRVATELREALRGADFVLTVFQIGGVEAYGFDVEIPRTYGIDQTVVDTPLQRDIFRGLRTVEALRVVAEEMLDICPGALLMNYANPMSVNCWATDLVGVPMVGLCHSVQGTSQLLARELGVPLEEVTFDCAGVNHTAWFTTYRRGDEDLIPRIREIMTRRHVERAIPLLPRSDDPYESIERVRSELMLLTGYFHTESSHHASEYWAWFRKTPELTNEYLDRRWDYLEICRSAVADMTTAFPTLTADVDGLQKGTVKPGTVRTDAKAARTAAKSAWQAMEKIDVPSIAANKGFDAAFVNYFFNAREKIQDGLKLYEHAGLLVERAAAATGDERTELLDSARGILDVAAELMNSGYSDFIQVQIEADIYQPSLPSVPAGS